VIRQGKPVYLKPPHTHKGYIHGENGTSKLSAEEKRMVDTVTKIWYNKKSKK